jgi:hypothetical protein
MGWLGIVFNIFFFQFALYRVILILWLELQFGRVIQVDSGYFFICFL